MSSHPHIPENDPPRSFADVLEDELKLIEWRRECLDWVATTAKEQRSGLSEYPPPPAECQVPEEESLKVKRSFLQSILADVTALVGFLKLALVGGSGEDGPPPPPRPPIHPAAADNDDERLVQQRQRALDHNLVGLAFSGGGVRSGSFAVGFLQGLARLNLLKRIDLLSTVSGGGYAGSFVSAWLRREGDPTNVEDQLDDRRQANSRADRHWMRKGLNVDEEPEPIHHLREYSSYMTPRSGILTADTWSIFTIYLRNISINLTMVLPAIFALVLAARLLLWAYAGIDQLVDWKITEGTPWYSDPKILLSALLAISASILTIRAFSINARAVRRIRDEDAGLPPLVTEPIPSTSKMIRLFVFPLLTAAVLGTMAFRLVLPQMLDFGVWLLNLLRDTPAGDLLGDVVQTSGEMAYPSFFSLPSVLFHAIVLGLSSGLMMSMLYWSDRKRLAGRPEFVRRYLYIWCSAMAGAMSGVLLALTEQLLKPWFDHPEVMMTAAPALALGIVGVALTILVALLSRGISPREREWWARLSALTLFTVVSWLILMASIWYVPAGLIYLNSIYVTTGAALTWLVATVWGVLAGRSPLTSNGSGNSRLEWIVRLAPSVFLIGLLAIISLAAAAGFNTNPELRLAGQGQAEALLNVKIFFRGIIGANARWTLLMMLGLFYFSYKFARQVDVNLFSLHEMYANRLVRCYLGASRAKERWVRRWRQHDRSANGGASTQSGTLNTTADGFTDARCPDPFTGFDPNDDLGLVDLRVGWQGSYSAPYLGPHLIVNAALNTVAGEELAYRDRKCESFVLTPLDCGSRSTGYRPLTSASAKHMTLGRAMSISGAAIDPNMSFHQSAPMTAMLTLFNARLGWWLQNPKYPRPGGLPWAARSPYFNYLLWDELFGQTSSDGEYIHLSDGGHFENLGVYELIRRRCRFIIALDAGEDSSAVDGNLANLIRLIRIDFGVRVTLDAAPLTESGPEKQAKQHCVIGEIHYEDVDPGAEPGLLIYVKISMTGDESPDLLQYAATTPFPHHPTFPDQFFDEAQFESYRALGSHIARSVFQDAARALPAHLKNRVNEESNFWFFQKVKLRWA